MQPASVSLYASAFGFHWKIFENIANYVISTIFLRIIVGWNSTKKHSAPV